MMTTRTERDRRERRYADVNNRLDYHDAGFSPTAFKPPEGVSVFRFKKEGVYDIDVLPYEVKVPNKYAEAGELYYEKTLIVHRRIGPDQNDYCCLRRMYGEACPVCEEVERIGSDRSEQGKKKFGALRDKEVQLFKFKVLNHDEERKKGTQLYYTGFFKSFGQLLETELQFIRTRNKEDPRLRFWRHKGGYTMSVFVEEDKMEGGKKFMAPKRIEIVPRKHDYDDRDIDDICLDDLPVKTDYDALAAILAGTGAKREVREDVERSRSEDRDDRVRDRDYERGRHPEEVRGRPRERDDFESGADRGRERDRDEPRGRDRLDHDEPRGRDRDDRDERDDREARQGSPGDDAERDAGWEPAEDDEVVHVDYGPGRVVKVLGDGLLKIEVKGGKVRTCSADEVTLAEDEPADREEDRPKSRREEPEEKPARKSAKGRDADEPPAKRDGKALTTAQDKGLKVGYKVEHFKHGRCTIVHVSADGTSLKIRDKDGEVHSAVQPEEVERVGATEAPKEPAKEPARGKARDREESPRGKDDDLDPLPPKGGRGRR
jgi:hypothetical protein